LLVLFTLGLGGCSSVAYYAQSVQGQLGVMSASRPLDEVVADPQTDETVREKLRRLPSILQFAMDDLGLPETDSYRLYADLQRKAMVWNLVAAPVDSLEPRTWCYPVLGCTAYRGYFREASAHKQAAGLTADGWDTAVEPVPAYSTLGWFSDPLPSTVIHWSLADIAGLVFHELAHEKLYVSGDSAFNEAYATVVEQEGVRRWLQRFGSEAQLEQRRLAERRRRDFLQLLSQTRQQLDAVYAADVDAGAMLSRKSEVLQLLRKEYAGLKESWNGYSGYDRWMLRPLNNAHLASVNTYYALEPAFRELLRQSGGDMGEFQRRCAAIAESDKVRREAAMKGLLELASRPR